MCLHSSDCLRVLCLSVDVVFLFCHIYPAWCSSELLVSVDCCLSLILESSQSLFFSSNFCIPFPFFFIHLEFQLQICYTFWYFPIVLVCCVLFFTLLSLFVLIFIDLTHKLKCYTHWCFPWLCQVYCWACCRLFFFEHVGVFFTVLFLSSGISIWLFHTLSIFLLILFIWSWMLSTFSVRVFNILIIMLLNFISDGPNICVYWV